MPTSPVEYDVAVIGAGPAGLAAAVSVAESGATVAMLDSAPRTGGQYWRHRAGDDGRHHQHWPMFQRLLSRSDRVDHLAGHAVWHIESGFTSHAVVDGRERTVRSRAVIIATGAYDRQLPFPGWTLPGVYTAGAVQALVKGHGVLAGRRIAVAGTGPFLLAVAAGLLDAGATVIGVYEAGSPLRFARHPLAVAGALGKLGEGAGYLRTLRRHRVPYRTRTAVIAAHGCEDVTGITVAKLDAAWHVVPGSERRVDCDTVAVGYGFTPQLELALQLGCESHVDVDGSLVATVDDDQRTSVPGVYVAGEACGVGGAALAVLEGRIAGLSAVGAHSASLRRQRAALRRFAAAMHDSFPVPAGWTGWLDDDTIVCRCEEVTHGAIIAAVTDLQATDPRAVKLFARPGMGLCQGRVCGYATACLVADRLHRAPTAADLRGLAARPIAQPITLGALAAGAGE